MQPIKPMQPSKAAVIGVGHLGQHHAEKYAALDDVELIGVCDHDLARTLEVAQRCETTDYLEYDELISDADVVSIAVPTSAHFEVARDCLNAGCHVLIEKPITAKIEEAQTLVDLAQRKQCILQVGHLERFNPAFTAAIDRGVTQAQFIEATRIAPFNSRGCDVDVIMDLMIHDIDLIHAVVRSPIANISAVGASAVTGHPDIVNARINFENGCVANLTASRISAKMERKMRIFQHHSYISLDFLRRKYECSIIADTSNTRTFHVNTRTICFPTHDALMDEIVHFVNCVRTGQAPFVTGEKGLRALQTAAAIRQQLTMHQSAHLQSKG